MTHQQDGKGMDRRTFMAGAAALVGAVLVPSDEPPRSRSEALEHPFLGGVLNDPERLPQFRQVPSEAFTDPQCQIAWTAIRIYGSYGTGVTRMGLDSHIRFMSRLLGRPDVPGLVEHLASVAAPARLLPELAKELTRDTDPRPVHPRRGLGG